MVGKRTRVLSTLVIILAVIGTALGSATASAAELGDYLWGARPLLLFAPTDTDPRVVETLSRIEADRCEFVNRDVVIGVVVTEGNSTLDGQTVNAEESQRIRDEFAVDEDAFTVLLIGKDGGEKLRVNEIPDLRTVLAVIDGMPMRIREMGVDPGRC